MHVCVRTKVACAVLLAMLLMIGCTQEASRNRSDYIGEYLFTPSVTDIPASSADLVRLRSDGSAVEIRFDASGRLLATETTWSLIETKTGLGLVIGGFKHTVSRRGSVVRLDSNADLNEYYEKVR